MQPRRNFCVTAKTAEVAKSGQKSFLSCIAGVLFAPQHPERESKNATLPAAHNFAESLRVTRERSLYHLLVVRNCFHLASARAGPRRPNVLRNTLHSQLFRRAQLFASLQKMAAGVAPGKN